MKKILGYSDFTNTLYVYCHKDGRDKENVTEQFEHIIRKVCKLNGTKEVKIGGLILQVKEQKNG